MNKPHKSHELLGLGFFVVAIILLLSLETYSPNDPGLFAAHLSSDKTIGNFIGLFGAYFSDLSLHLFGHVAYLFVLITIFSGWLCFARFAQLSSVKRATFWVGNLLVLSSSSTLLSLYVTQSELPRGSGGVLGYSLANGFTAFMNMGGATMVGITLLLIGISMVLRLSLVSLCEDIGKACFFVLGNIGTLLTNKLKAGNNSIATLKHNRRMDYDFDICDPADNNLVKKKRKDEQQAITNKTELAKNKAHFGFFGRFNEDRHKQLKPATPIINEEVIKTNQDWITPPPFLSNSDRSIPPEHLTNYDGITAQKLDKEEAELIIPDRHAERIEPPFNKDEQTSISNSSQSRNDNPSQDNSSLNTPTGDLFIDSPNNEESHSKTDSATINNLELKIKGDERIQPAQKASNPVDDNKVCFQQNNLEIAEQKVITPTTPTNATNEIQLPSLDLLIPATNSSIVGNEYEQSLMASNLEQKLNDFGIQARVVAVNPGPVVTRYELELAAGVKVAKVSSIAKDLARSLSVISIRVVEVIPGRPVIGIEVPNDDRKIVRLHEVLAANSDREKNNAGLRLALGHDIEGQAVITDLQSMPHLLVAGTTGSGKSVGINAMLISLLYHYKPQEVRLLLIDPKMLELSVYKSVPHLLTDVITDMKDAARGLRWCVMEMERRYNLLSKLGVRNLSGYNSKVENSAQAIPDPTWDATIADEDEEAPALDKLPHIVVVIDEYADMMMTVGKKAEELITRIAQKARAAGIHLILATQRPSVDVITGLIKANIPARISFQVSSKIDSRTVIDQSGAEQLLGHGDMLYVPSGVSIPIRIHGALVSDDEVHRVVEHWGKQASPQHIEEILQCGEDLETSNSNAGPAGDEDIDPLYNEAVDFVINSGKVSISSLQRKLKIGYNRSARMIETMEENQLVSPMEANGRREVLVPIADTA